MLYTITASKLTDLRTLSATSACYALAILTLLTKEGFEIGAVLDQHSRMISVDDVRRAASAEGAVDGRSMRDDHSDQDRPNHHDHQGEDVAPRLTGEQREAEIRRKLLIRAESTKGFINGLPAADRQTHQVEIDAYLVALRRWEDREPGSSVPDTPSFMRHALNRRHTKEAAFTQRSGSQA